LRQLEIEFWIFFFELHELYFPLTELEKKEKKKKKKKAVLFRLFEKKKFNQGKNCRTTN
jgi:hypothetical protein